ncbi:hypothetical protein PR202_ga10010 [Eleusine coracana subsp. coracana]|uniref:Uncharacterized protein n=1 Tax=Eleusine coracana subsp. coracana TaxID=191504 RepID=A0AAV5C5M2_ELECO|nr:hypothetical protein PR202_ga10010 [Eleusine coracana subsp. coracana]
MLEPAAMEVPISSSVNNAVVPAPIVHNPRARKLRSAVWQDFTKERRADVAGSGGHAEDQPLRNDELIAVSK